MSRIVLGKSGNCDLHLDLDILLRTRLLIQANSGGGKSFTIRRLAEQMFSKLQVIIIDPEGEFASLRERYGYVLVGKGGETPADPRSAELLAHKLLEVHASAVCDLFEMKPLARHEWVKRFLDALIDAPKKLWHPTAIIVDEAASLCPEKGAGESEASEAMISLATRGRKRGFAAIWATQRLGNLRKDAAAQMLNVLIGPTFIDVDRKRAAETLGVPRGGRDTQTFFDEIKILEPGNFFALGTAISKERVLVKIGPVETHHPETGSSCHAAEPPPPPEKVKELLPKLADLPRQAEEKARTEAELRSEIRSLKAQLREKPTSIAVKESTSPELRVARAKIMGLQSDIRHWRLLAMRIRYAYGTIAKIARRAAEAEIPDIPAEPSKAIPAEVNEPVKMVKIPLPVQRRGAPLPVVQTDNGEVKLREGARRMIAALCMWHPEAMLLNQMRAHAGLKKSGTFSSYMSDLRRFRLIEENGNSVKATDRAIELLGKDHATPSTTEEVLAVWLPKLRLGARRMLEVLVRAGGEPMPSGELQEKAGLAKSGTFSAYLSDLRTARLIRSDNTGIAADRETLFL